MNDDNNKYGIDCAMRWILFGVLIVVGPPLATVFYRLIVGMEVDFVEYLPDMLLVVLSVCCNLINNCVDREKRVSYIWRWILCIVFGLIAVGCWGLFFVIRFNSRITSGDLFKYTAEKIFYYSIGLLFVCAFIGVLIEVHTWRYKKKSLGDGFMRKIEHDLLTKQTSHNNTPLTIVLSNEY